MGMALRMVSRVGVDESVIVEETDGSGDRWGDSEWAWDLMSEGRPWQRGGSGVGSGVGLCGRKWGWQSDGCCVAVGRGVGLMWVTMWG